MGENTREELTNDIIPKLMLSDVIKQGGEYWEQGNGRVVDVLGHTFHLLERREAANGHVPVLERHL